MGNSGVFEPNWAHECCDVVADVDGRLLADLYDCVAKFGRYYHGYQMRSLSREGPRPLNVAVVVDPPGNYNMNVSRVPGAIMKGRVMTLPLSDGYSACFWDGDITVAEVRELIESVDAEMKDCGFLQDGSRRQVFRDDDRPGLLEVDKIFSQPGSVYLLPDGTDPAELKARFDRPEELHPVTMYGGQQGFVHKRDHRLVCLADATAEVLARHGLTNLKQFEDLPKQWQETVLREIAAELVKRDN